MASVQGDGLARPPATSPYRAHEAAIAYADGASRGNPGPSAFGCVYASSADLPLCGEGVAIGMATNNIAEYRGCIAALERLLSWKIRRATLRLDSQLVVRQLNREYRVKHENLKPLFAKAQALQRRFDDLRIEHVPREDNRLADRLANEALDRGD